ncbi:hypothetical protein [Peromfec virus RodF8_48]|uniref:Uncharacterized protein n=1 Tax=Peromfec virus RodF8_48 TaxID=2929379 RepID=A0A976R740_9VIRU|nr:hypothetical protein [Peromfec virus RodF8_48]
MSRRNNKRLKRGKFLRSVNKTKKINTGAYTPRGGIRL